MKILLYAALLGASLWILTEVLEMASAEGSTPLSLWLTTLWHPILAMGFWGLHRGQSSMKNSTLSMAGVILIILSLLAFAPVSVMILQDPGLNTFADFMEQNPFYQLVGLVSLIGYILFSVAVIRTRFYPGWTGYALLFTVLLSLVQTAAGLPELFQHMAFIGLSLVIAYLAAFALQHLPVQRVA